MYVSRLGQVKILLTEFFQLQEFGSRYEAETLRNSKKTDVADVIVYVHDSSDTNSFSYISNLRVTSPCLFSLLVIDTQIAAV